MRNYYFLITKKPDGDQRDIISIYSPDLERDLLEQHETVTAENYVTKVVDALSALQQEFARISPKIYEQIRQYPIIANRQGWEVFEIQFNDPGFFARTMPTMGNITTLLTILTGCLETFIAFRTISSNGNMDDSTSFNLSIASSLVSSIFGLVIYMYSGATQTLFYLGQNIDKSLANANKHVRGLCANNSMQQIINSAGCITRIKCGDLLEQLQCYDKRAVFNNLFSIFTTGIILANVGIGCVPAYQEKMGAIDRYLKSQNYDDLAAQERDREILVWLLVYISIVASVYSSLSFTFSFINKFISDVKNTHSKNLCSKGLFFSFNRTDYEAIPNGEATSELLEQPQFPKHRIVL